MPIDPDALMKLVAAADRAGIVEQVGKIAGEVMKRVVNEPDVDYEKFFGGMANKMNFDVMTKGVSMVGKFSNLLNPIIRLAANDFVMMVIAIPLSMPFVQKIGVNVASKVAILVLKGKMPKMLPSLKRA